MRSGPVSVAVVGAGLAGLACARELAARGVRVTVLDKGRSVGGRLSVSRVPPHTFDLGAQYFTARDDRFVRERDAWLAAGACAAWRGRIVAIDGAGGAARPVDPIERLVGTPDMNALAHHLAGELRPRRGHRVESIARRGDRLALRGTVAPPGVTLPPARPGAGGAPGGEDLGSFDGVALCVPATQAAALLGDASPRLAGEASAVPLEPCLALGFAAGAAAADALRALPFDGAFVGRDGAPAPAAPSPLAWVARDSSKPGRPPGERWVLHASAAWSRAWFDRPEAEVTEALLAELARLFALPPLAQLRPEVSVLRRWALARAPRPLAYGALFDDDARVGLGGDWACDGRVEGAFLSGLALAERMARALGAPAAGPSSAGHRAGSAVIRS